MKALFSLGTRFATVLALVLAGCGGGATTTTTVTGGGSGGSGGGTTIPTTASVCEASPAQSQSYQGVAANNRSPLYMDECLIGDTLWSINTLYVSVYLCAPGSTTACGWIDHVEVDTGSVGLRLLASAIPTAVLNAMPTYQVSTTNGTGTVGECFQFVTSYTWGAWRQADVRLGGTPSAVAPTAPPVVASGIPIQVLNDPAVPATATTAPTSGNPAGQDICQTVAGSSSRIQKTAGNLGANGIIGIGLWKDECQGNCSQLGLPITFVQCFSTGYCSPFSSTATSGAANPVAAGGLNGLSITVDPVATLAQNRQVFTDAAGYGNPWVVAGYLGYGVPSPAGSPASTLAADIFTGRIAAKVAGVQFPSTGGGDANGVFFDTGSTAHFIAPISSTSGNGVFTSAQLPLQACPTSSIAAGDACTLASQPTSFAISALLAPSGTATVTTGVSMTGINIVDALTSLNGNGPFYDGLVSLNGSAGEFDFGMPAFFGRTLYFGIYDSTVAGTPYYGL